MDELERILEAEDTIEPSSGLSDSIMQAVRQEAATPAPIRFPWGRFLAGMGATLIAVVAVGMAGLTGWLPATTEPWDLPALSGSRSATTLSWAALALLGSYVSIAVSFRLAGSRR